MDILMLQSSSSYFFLIAFISENKAKNRLLRKNKFLVFFQVNAIRFRTLVSVIE